MNRKFFAAALLPMLFFVLVMGMSSCEDDSPSNEVKYNNIVLSGANERPTVVNSPATGTFNGTYDKETKMITFTVTWTGNTTPITAMHFHNAVPTANLPATAVAGGVVIGVPANGTTPPYTSPVTGTTRALTEDEEIAFLAGNWYYNIHSTQFPGGELRGQIVP